MGRYQLSQRQIDMMEKNQRKEQQRRYDEDLSHQIKLKSQMLPSNST